ncbi:DUF4145 domain-containing protein [Janthinobacterium sp. PSPC1-1]|uniref:DUF4145 domain-containing protein n=1 Tax=Janthinobacterium sp. PSPC1-1 TaxID=2804581 RepID=UPI003CF9B980
MDAHKLNMQEWQHSMTGVIVNIVPADFNTKSFTCPHCGVLARQRKWGYDLAHPMQDYWQEVQIQHASLKISLCEHCAKNCLWVNEDYVYPPTTSAPRPNPDMPTEIMADYLEAAGIYRQSPRGGAALLRLSIQKLMVYLGERGKNINEDIAALVAKGLPKQVQQALDIVRITGNNAVHPGQLDADDVGIAEQLFPLVNIIVEYQISMPARVQELYDALPAGALAGIAKRDAT